MFRSIGGVSERDRLADFESHVETLVMRPFVRSGEGRDVSIQFLLTTDKQPPQPADISDLPLEERPDIHRDGFVVRLDQRTTFEPHPVFDHPRRAGKVAY